MIMELTVRGQLAATLVSILLLRAGDVESNPGPSLGDRPKLTELINLPTTTKPLQFIKEVTACDESKCSDFAEILLNDATTVATISPKLNENRGRFVREVLKDWLSKNDDDPNEPAAPRTWGSLADCAKAADLPGRLVQAIRTACTSNAAEPVTTSSAAVTPTTHGGGASPSAAGAVKCPVADANTIPNKLTGCKFPEYKWKELARGLVLSGEIRGIESNNRGSGDLSCLLALIDHWCANVSQDNRLRWEKLVKAVDSCKLSEVAKALAKDVGVPYPPRE